MLRMAWGILSYIRRRVCMGFTGLPDWLPIDSLHDGRVGGSSWSLHSAGEPPVRDDNACGVLHVNAPRTRGLCSSLCYAFFWQGGGRGCLWAVVMPRDRPWNPCSPRRECYQEHPSCRPGTPFPLPRTFRVLKRLGESQTLVGPPGAAGLAQLSGHGVSWVVLVS